MVVFRCFIRDEEKKPGEPDQPDLPRLALDP
jgi:hypothetical protein